MSVRHKGLCLALLLGAAGMAWAQEDPLALAKSREDPLLIRPPVLDRGAVLPGDNAPAPCANPGLTDKPLSLADAVDIALCNNPQVQSAWAAIKVQAAALGEAKAANWPTISAGVSVLNDHTAYSSTYPDTASHGVSKNVGLNWRLFDFGARAAEQRSAAALLDAALAGHGATLQKTLETLIGAYFDAQTALAGWQAKQKGEALARDTLAAAQRREARGAGAQSDTLQASTALARASLDRSRAHGDYQKALSVLVYVMGIPASTPLQLAPDLADDSHGLGQDLNAWLVQAQNQHPAISAARAQLNAARQKVVATRSEGLPTIDLGANVYQNGRPNQGLPSVRTTEAVLGVTLNIPLFEGFARTYKVSGAQAQAEQKESDLQDVTHQVLMDVVKAHADAQAALENLESSRQLLQAAQLALTSVQRKFERGAADIVEMLNTQAALADADQQRIRCLAEWRSARLRLLAATGGLGRQAIVAAPTSTEVSAVPQPGRVR